MRKFLLCLLFFCFSWDAYTQPPPAVKPPSDGVKKASPWQSVKSLPAVDGFVSLEGRFKIALPTNIQGYSGISTKESGTSATGQQFVWKFAEANITGFYLDNPDSDVSGSAAELALLSTGMQSRVVSKWPAAKLVSQGTVPGTVPYAFFVYDLGSEGFVAAHSFLVGKRLFHFNVAFTDRTIEDYISRAMVTFEIITQRDVDAELRRKQEDMKPEPLPQSPVVNRLTSDAEDKGLKGSVAKIVEEFESKEKGSSALDRRMSSAEYYDRGGAITQRESYDHRGNLRQITVYGYIDGKRVSMSKTTSYEYDPPPPPPAPGSSSEPTRDRRYEYSHKFKYEDGKLVERELLSNNGKKLMRYAYKHSPNQLEKLVYSSDGKLNQRYVSILDAKGNEIEETSFGLANFDIYGDRKYRYSYEFDSKGNWIKKTAFTEVKENGTTRWEPSYISYRTINYY